MQESRKPKLDKSRPTNKEKAWMRQTTMADRSSSALVQHSTGRSSFKNAPFGGTFLRSDSSALVDREKKFRELMGFDLKTKINWIP